MVSTAKTIDLNKIVLIQPPIRDFYITRKRTIPIGLASIAGSLIQSGFDVNIVDGLATSKSRVVTLPQSFSYLNQYYSDKDITLFSLFHDFKHYGYSHEHLAHQVRLLKPFLVGVSSLFTAYEDQAVETARHIKRFWPECKIVIGGHHPTVFPEDSLKDPSIDFVIRGEGEESMVSLARALQGKIRFDDVPGLCYQKSGKTCLSPPAWLTSLKTLALPANQLINPDFYQRNKRGSISIISSRGCPMQCSYCSVAASSAHGRYRQRSVDNVVSEIKMQLSNRNVGFIDFEDENLCLNKDWFNQLFSRLIPMLKGKDVELRAMNGLYPPSLDDEIVPMLKKAGFKTLNLALASTDTDQLKRFKRQDVRPDFERILSLAQKYDLDCVSYLIGSAPGQSASSTLNDLMYLARKRTLIGFSVFYPAPGSLDYQKCHKNGILPDQFINMRSSAIPIEGRTSRLQSVTLLRLARILNFMKKLIDRDGTLPDPETCPDSSDIKMESSISNDRFGISVQLLRWFLNDGIIRGIRPDGSVFQHKIDISLTHDFLDLLSSISISGVACSAPPS